MSAVVVDASAMVEVLRGTAEGRAVSDALRDRTAVSPGHFDAEVLSTLGRMARAGDVEVAHVEFMLARLVRAPIKRYAIAPFVRDAWSLRENTSLRDAFYVILARRLKAPFVTLDARLAGAPSLGISVMVVGS